ncbi:tail fiber protein [Synechococcus phage S-H34]|uniref:Tail fiber protein n=1 Tax=Synechococcus phage S-H34 TaxID=2718942 RepID=A0A6G8R6B0_9CAUD|nr:tail fiber protein [Synechococcus phage S-H34]QIN96937.1 tail fiber protein [Synechococcus phage S-H34]
MTLNFPTSPSVNDTYTYNGTTFVWDGEKWDASTPFLVNTANIVDDAVTPAKVAVDDYTFSAINGGQLAGFRNQLINSDFRIWQRGQTFTDEGFTADRWQILGSGNVTSVSRISQGTSPGSFNDALPFTRAAQLVLTGTGFFSQYIEIDYDQDARFRNNQLITLSWWTTATQVANDARISFTDTSANLNTSSNFTQTDFSLLETVAGWNHYKATFRCDQSPLASSRAVRVVLLFSAGTSSVSGVQLEPGSVATPVEIRPIQTELALCQRYFYKFSGELYASTYARNDSSGDYRVVNFSFHTTMRSTPSMNNVTFSGGGTNLQIQASASAISVIQSPKQVTASTALKNFEADAEL